jgi:exopolysaccharide biosynthesis polyprenyl glycosylphosphotransferase
LREGELATLLLVGDLVVAGIAAIGAPALWATFDREFAPRFDLRPFETAFILAWVVLLRVLGRGELASPRFGRRALAAVGRAAFAISGLVLMMFFLAPFFAPRGSTLLTLPLAAAATLAWRSAYLRVLRGQILERRVAIVGTDEAARRTAQAIAQRKGALRYNIVAFFAAENDSVAPLPAVPLVRLDERPWSTIAELGIDLLVVGHTQSVPPALLAELTRCFEHGVEAIPATMLYEELTGRVLASALEADWYAELPTYTRGLYTFVKRAVDIAVALIASAVALLLSPFIALAIVVDSGPPVFLSQTRIGLRGQPFTVHKFRTMRQDAEDDGRPRWAQPSDPRITRVGQVLRRLRLDELPQLWDVLRGKMSLVGPRPERPEFVEQLSRELPLYRARSLVRPGITGWAQVQYPYAESVQRNLAKLEYDLYYIRRLGPLLDIAVLLRTLPVILRPQHFDP